MPPAARRCAGDVWLRSRGKEITEQQFYRPSSLLDGAERAVSSSAVNSSNARPSRSSPALSRKAISWSSGESMIVASSASSTGSRSPRSLPQPLEFLLHPQRGLPQLGVGLGGAAKDQGLVATSQTLLVVTDRRDQIR